MVLHMKPSLLGRLPFSQPWSYLMWIYSRTALMFASGLALATALTTGHAIAQGPPAGRGMMAGQGMMADRQKMMAEMQASQTKLDELVAAMNTSTGAQKMDRIAAVLTELVGQHRNMGVRMLSMGGTMMQPPQATTTPAGEAPPGPALDPPPTGAGPAGHHPKP
jgi:hypothetical protein